MFLFVFLFTFKPNNLNLSQNYNNNMSRIQVITSLISDTCCICLERKDIVYKCIQCNEAKLCGECYKEMREYTLRRTRCPTCRKTSWVVEIRIFIFIHNLKKQIV